MSINLEIDDELQIPLPGASDSATSQSEPQQEEKYSVFVRNDAGDDYVEKIVTPEEYEAYMVSVGRDYSVLGNGAKQLDTSMYPQHFAYYWTPLAVDSPSALRVREAGYVPARVSRVGGVVAPMHTKKVIASIGTEPVVTTGDSLLWLQPKQVFDARRAAEEVLASQRKQQFVDGQFKNITEMDGSLRNVEFVTGGMASNAPLNGSAGLQSGIADDLKIAAMQAEAFQRAQAAVNGGSFTDRQAAGGSLSFGGFGNGNRNRSYPPESPNLRK